MNDRAWTREDRAQGDAAPAAPQLAASSDHREWAGKLLALDVGQARIGIAVCDPLQLAARPLMTLQRRTREQDFARIAVIISQQAVNAVVCGLPLNMDGSEGGQAQRVRNWSRRLAHALPKLLGRPVPVLFADERLSTFAAHELLAGASSKAGEDAAAAAVILQSFLDGQRRGDLPDLGAIVLAEPAAAVDQESAP